MNKALNLLWLLASFTGPAFGQSMPEIHSGTPGSPHVYDLHGMVISEGWNGKDATGRPAHDVVFRNGGTFTGKTIKGRMDRVIWEGATFTDFAGVPAIDINGSGNQIEGGKITRVNCIYALQMSHWDATSPGNVLRNVTISDVSDRAAQFAGFNNQALYNVFSRWNTSGDRDTGCIYLGGVRGDRGFRGIGNTIDGTGTSRTDYVIGIYLDGNFCEGYLRDNTLRNISHGISISGGRDNTVENNRFPGCKVGVQIDDRAGNAWPEVAKLPPLSDPCYKVFPLMAAMARKTAVITQKNGYSALCYVGNDAQEAIGNKVLHNDSRGCEKMLHVRQGGKLKPTHESERKVGAVTFKE